MDSLHDAGRGVARGRQVRFSPQSRRALRQGSRTIAARRVDAVRHSGGGVDRRNSAKGFPERKPRARTHASPSRGRPDEVVWCGAGGGDREVVVFGWGLALLTGLLLGVIPALGATRIAPAESLKEGAKGSGGIRSRKMGGILVAAEVAVCLVLLIG